VTHVAVARPHFLDLEATPVSEGVKAHRRFHQRDAQMHAQAIAQGARPAPAVLAPVAPAPESSSSMEGAIPAAASPPPRPLPLEPTPEMAAVMNGLCTGSSTRGTSSNLPTDLWKRQEAPAQTATKPVKTEAKPGAIDGTAASAAVAPDGGAVSVEAPAAEAATLPGEFHATTGTSGGRDIGQCARRPIPAAGENTAGELRRRASRGPALMIRSQHAELWITVIGEGGCWPVCSFAV